MCVSNLTIIGNGRRTFDGWIATVKSMEFIVAMTVRKLEKGEAYKTKNKDSLLLDNIFESLVAKHKNNTLSCDQFFDEVVKKHADYDLFLEQNNDLDEEEESDSME